MLVGKARSLPKSGAPERIIKGLILNPLIVLSYRFVSKH